MKNAFILLNNHYRQRNEGVQKKLHVKAQMFVSNLLEQMTLSEKIGQMCQRQALEGHVDTDLANAVRSGAVGSILNEVDAETINRLQHIAVEESPLGIPLLMARDVIHGFKTTFPIPLAQAASWDTELVTRAARLSAVEASSVGINWTFSPVADVTRDPRWGRIAETFGEDPYLCAQMSSAMVEGYQGDDLSSPTSIAACAKHFIGYGAVESGRDYATTNISDHELFNTHLPPFESCIDQGVATVMTSFCDINGVPATANKRLNKHLLKDQLLFTGITVSDWEAVTQLTSHGVTENDRGSALAALNAAIDIEMVSTTYQDHLLSLLDTGEISEKQIDDAVSRILTLKYNLGLFQNPFVKNPESACLPDESSLELAKELATKSCVLLKNEHNTLPLDVTTIKRIALIGPLADDGYEQLGTWIFDGDETFSTSCRQAIEQQYGQQIEIEFVRGLSTSRSTDQSEFPDAMNAAQRADAVVLFLGEESLLSGEAHCRSDIRLPGAQQALIKALKETGTPLIATIMAGRPIVVNEILDDLDSLLMIWHPGSQAGPAVADLLFGKRSPSGKLPVTVPRNVGQIPIYYGQKRGGKPVNQHNYAHMDDFPQRAAQTSMGMVSAHIDSYFTPQFPFGFGLTYSPLEYGDLQLSHSQIEAGQSLEASIGLKNLGQHVVVETVQLYIQDKVASVTRPVKELKGFKQVRLEPGEHKRVGITLSTDGLKFYDEHNQLTLQKGAFKIWLGGSSEAQHSAEFSLLSGSAG